MKTVSSIAVQILLAVLFTVISVIGVFSILEINALKQRETAILQRTGTLTTNRMANSRNPFNCGLFVFLGGGKPRPYDLELDAAKAF